MVIRGTGSATARRLQAGLATLLLALTASCGGSSSVQPSAAASQVATASASQAPATPAGEAATHRITVQQVDGRGVFWDTLTDQAYVPRGMNYIRLDDYHNTFGYATYDVERAEEALARMQADGFNVVRVFLDHRYGGLGGGTFQWNAYLENIADFLARAKAHDLTVMLTGEWLPDREPYFERSAANVEGVNAQYLAQGGIDAHVRFWHDFVSGLTAIGADTDAVFAYSLKNELYFEATEAPLSLRSGTVMLPNTLSYDLADAAQRKAMIDDGLTWWFDQVRTAIREVDPSALVTVGFFQPQEPIPNRAGDTRYIQTPNFLANGSADFNDIHLYPGLELTLEGYMTDHGAIDGQGRPVVEAKPLLMGEFGLFRSSAPGVADAARILADWQAASCAYGFDGWMLWTWDSEEQPALYSAVGDGAVIEEALAPALHPDPCKGYAGS
jgi:hypothetical protein